MTATVERVYTDPADIDRLQALVAQLPNDAHVELHLDDECHVRGTVSARPTLQAFVDPAGREGMNGLVRIEDRALEMPESAQVHDIWLDRIVEVRHCLPTG
ncbi:DUF3247 family protein [Lysobacter sp. A3-1-A15]|uniref:DUF3247 family protein n=1 Tax=Novilysobacter viscosus TaxID=3098602 RepID=UPI002EDB033D